MVRLGTACEGFLGAVSFFINHSILKGLKLDRSIGKYNITVLKYSFPSVIILRQHIRPLDGKL